MSTLNVKLLSNGVAIPYGPAVPSIHVSFHQEDFDAAKFRHYCDPAGAVSIENMPDGHFRVHPRAIGYQAAPLDILLPQDGQGQIVIEMAKDGSVPTPTGPLSRLRAEKSGFVNREGRRVVIAGVSAFMHYERFLRGENIQPLLEQARELGANCLRVFGMAHYIPVNAGRQPFKPADYGDRYFDAQPNFFALAAEYGQYVYWSVFPDVDLVKPGPLPPFFDREVAMLERAENTFGEVTNEQDAHSFNAVDPATLHRPTVIACCSGSYGDIGEAQPHPWDFVDYHLPRRYDPPTHIKDACVVDHPNYLQGYGVLLGEPDRYGTGGNLDHDQARMSAGACRETALGMVFHTTQGRESLMYDDATMAQGRVFFRALIGGVNL